MFAQAIGFSVLAAISPTALLVMAVFLGSANPRRTALLYVAGAVVMTVTMAVTGLVVLRAIGLEQPRLHDPRYELRMGIGIIALTAAVVVWRRRRPAVPPDAAEPAVPRGIVARLVAQPKPAAAFVAGLVLFAPSAAFVAAVQAVATAEANAPVTALALLAVVLISCIIAWLPLLAFLAAPDATTRHLKTFNGWLRAKSRLLLAGALLVCGVALVLNGALGLVGVF